MPIRFAWLGLARGLFAWAALAIVLAVIPPSYAQQPQPSAESAALEPIKRQLDDIEAAMGREGLSAQALTDLRATISSVRDALQDKVAELEPRVSDVGSRVKQLGPPPAKDAPPEEAAVTEERDRLMQSFSELDGALKQLRLLALRADQIGERLTDRRRTLYAQELFARSASLLDPFFWVEVANALPRELRAFSMLPQSWAGSVEGHGGWLRVATAALLLGGILIAAVGITRRWLPRLDKGPRADSRFARARTGLWVFIWLAVRTPLAVLVGLMVLEALGLLPDRIEEISRGLVAGLVAASFGRGVARGLLAPDKPERRLFDIEDRAARSFHDHLVWSTRAFGATIILQVVHKVLLAPLVLTVATNALFALVVAGLLLHLVISLRRAEKEEPAETIVRAPWVRLLAWLAIVAIVGALVAGYAGFAAFIALRAVVAAAVFGALYLLLVVADALFTESINGDTRRGRSIAANLGIAPRNLELVGTLISAGIRVLLILLALLLIVGPWEASTAGLFESLQRLPLGFRVGEFYVSFRAVIAAVAALIVIIVITRVMQRWLQTQFLPRTGLEPSLQLSIVTIFGYIGIITALALALGGLGIDLQKIAFIAGALSVGIGFGLQSIVSNFVSGLILLAERPIRVGDSIVVKGEEGWVRRIRVRATEIETFDRARVIVPNSELITGIVKNWTHTNTLGRVVVKIGVSYDSDPEQVRDLLLGLAQAHPQIVQIPPPRAFLAAFGDSALDFELRCVIANVENGLAVKSDLHFAILARFRQVGIEIPYPQRDIRIRRDDDQRPDATASAAIPEPKS